MPKSKSFRAFAGPSPTPGDLSPDKMLDKPLTVEVDGHDYKIGRVTLDDISAVYARIRDNRQHALLRQQKHCRDHVLSQAMAYSAAIDPTQEDYWAYAETPGGLVYIVWRAMARYQPNLTEADVAALLEKQGGIIDLLFAESGMVKPKPPDDPDAEGENRDPLLDPPVFERNRPSDGSKAQAG